jgi:hypothetical protein
MEDQMRTNVMPLRSLLFATVLGSLTIVPGANATTIVTQANSCTNYNAGEAQDLDRVFNGVRNLNASPRYATCSVPRVMPMPEGQSDWFFNVSGNNSGGAETCCTIYGSRSYDGAYLGAASFCTTDATYDHLLSLASTTVNVWDYTSILCRLPASARGTLRGFTSHDPD